MLYDSQKVVMDNAAPSHFYNLGTSSGKSLIAIYHYLKHRNNEPLLIICPPQKKKTGEWSEEVEKVEQYENITIDYEVLSSSMLAKNYSQYKSHFVVFDEAHYFKNPTSKRGKAAWKLSRYATHFILLTATAGEEWADFMNYFIMFGFYKNKTQFLKAHAIYKDMYLGNRTIKVIDHYRDEETLFRLWNSIATVKPTEHFVDLPSTVDKNVKFKKSAIYNKAAKDRVIELNGEEIILDTPMKLSTTLRYLTNQKDKINYLKMILESTQDNVIVFYQFKREAEALKSMISKLDKTLYILNGQDAILPTKSDKEGLKDSVTIVQYQSGSEAVELKYASIVIYYTPTYSYTLYEQSKGRAVRHGGQDNVTFFNFKTVGTIETKVWTALENKRDFDEKLYLESLGG